MLTDPLKFGEFKHLKAPYEHQAKLFTETKNLSRYGLLWEMGVGKTKPILDTIVYLFLNQKLDGAIIVAPKGAYLNWIRNEIPAHISKDIPIRVGHWDADWNKRDKIRGYQMLKAEDDLLDIFLMNIEALSTERACQFAFSFIKNHYSMMVIDESSKIANHKAKRTINAIKLGRFCDFRRIMSGTPMCESPLDIFAQAHFLSPGLLGHQTFTPFKNYYATIKYIRQGGRSYEKILGYRNLDELTERLKTFTSRITKEECLDLPEKNFIDHFIEHTPEQAEAYRKIKEEALIMLEDQKDMISAQSVLTSIMKLHQINCGHVKTDTDRIFHIPHNRCNELVDLLSLHNGKIIIWAYFRQDFINILEAVGNIYGKESIVEYYGETTALQRTLNLERFLHDPGCRYLVANPLVAGMSLTLVISHWNIYYSYGYNLESWLQSQDRTHRIGQTENVTYTLMQIPRTMDTKILQALKMKKHLADEVLDNWRLLLNADD